MEEAKVAALARTVLFRRLRSVLIRPEDDGMIATTLNFDYEVRSEDAAFADIPKLKLDKEMLELASHIIKTKSGRFDPAGFDDRYESALAELVKAKIEGRKIKPPPKKRAGKVVSLLEALRESAKGGADAKPARKRA
jgi:DNA end-binding protein Ku